MHSERTLAVMLADLSGSTALYERLGNAAALALVNQCLMHLRETVAIHGGNFVHSNGDDVLATFPDPASGFAAAQGILRQDWPELIAVHAGIDFGSVIVVPDDVFGDPVNLSARLAAAANPGEILVSKAFADRLPIEQRFQLRRLDALLFKGKSVATDVFSVVGEEGAMLTQISVAPGAMDRGATSVSIEFGGSTWSCREGESLSIGRAEDNTVVLPATWVSRSHATIAVRGGKVQLSDRSTAGTYVAGIDGRELLLHRETMLLLGDGTIAPGISAADPEAQVLRYSVGVER